MVHSPPARMGRKRPRRRVRMAFHRRKQGQVKSAPQQETRNFGNFGLDDEVSAIIEKMLEGQQAKKRAKPTLRKFSWEAAEGGALELSKKKL